MSYFNQTKITNSNGTTINPATEESVLLLRKVVKLLESNATIDPKQRQKVVVEAIGTNNTTPTELNAAIPVTIGAAISANSTAVASAVNMGNVVVQFGAASTASGIDSRFAMIDTARTAYATGIRSNLKWS